MKTKIFFTSNIKNSFAVIYLILLIVTNSYCQELWSTTTISNAPTARMSHTSVWTDDKMIVWGGQQYGGNDVNTGGIYDMLSGSWVSTSISNAPEARELHKAVWTGSKMIIWGGVNFSTFNFPNIGGVFDPTLNTWNPTTSVNAPSGRIYHTIVWTGDKMIVWGGSSPPYGETDSGSIYNPVNNTWTNMSTVNAPTARDYHIAIWTGSKMIIWGGEIYGNVKVNTGGIYDPTQNSWTETSVVNAPAARIEHTAIWTGNKMIVWGGTATGGGIYDPFTDTWTPVSDSNAPVNRYDHTAVWTSARMIIWGGLSIPNSYPLNSGGIYDPLTNLWSATTLANAPYPRVLHTAIWTGNKMIVWGGESENGPMNTGGIYFNPNIIGIENSGTTIPKVFALKQNYPNPFNPITYIKFDIAKKNQVKITIFDIQGKLVCILVDEEMEPGSYKTDWNAVNYSSGVYIYRIETRQAGSSTGDFVNTKKMVLIK
jgi:hypothetical protein